MITATISTYNREKYIPKVLQSLKNQTLAKDQFEIVFVDNNSPDNTKALAENFKKENPDIRFHYYLETNQGLSFGRNRGIQEAQGEFITFIDDDAHLAPDYLEKILNYFDQYKDVVAIGSKILLDYESIKPKWENKYLNSLLGYFNKGDEAQYFSKKDYPRGSNMSFRMSVFEAIGLFNTDLGRKGKNLAGSEEKDIFNRIYDVNHYKVLYVPDAIVYHYVPPERTTKNFIQKQALGTGVGERSRVKKEGFSSYLKRLLLEFYKWIGSIVLYFIYLFQNKNEKGMMILHFRFWVTLGLLGIKKN